MLGAFQGFLEGLVCFSAFCMQVVLWPVFILASFLSLSVCLLSEFLEFLGSPFLGLYAYF
jgi:hypothetical protein